MILRLSLVATISFAAGVLTMDVAHDWRDVAKKAELGRQAYACRAHGKELAVTTSGDFECRNLMARFEPWWPTPGNPVKLTKRELRKAISR